MANYEKTYDLFKLAMQMQESGEGVSLEDIQRDYGVSRRTAERMRNALYEFFPQMEEVDTGERTKRWRIAQHSLNSLISFSAEELAVFKTAINTLKKRSMNDKAEILSRIELKLRNLIKPEQKRRIEVDAEELMKAEGLALRPGPKIMIDKEILSKIRAAILSCHQIKISYFNRQSGKISHNILMPYGILYGERNHYLLARHSDGFFGNEVHNFILSNIQSIEILPNIYQIPEDFSLEEYSMRSFGVFQEPPFEVEWLFDKETAEEAKRYIFHPTQQVRENPDGTLTVKFKAGGRLEMDWHLYTWGNHVKVIKPDNWYEETQV
ncbi:MAG: WYL domain-containing protein [Alphaproteobacteria bacterium]|nr:WYL domain-containing protein [Alphaproteobacteria bacterium]